MKKKQIIILILMVLICNLSKHNVFGQEQEEDEFDKEIRELKEKYPVPTLTKEQMYEDIDSLIAIVRQRNPQYLIKKQVTGYDMLERINILREKIAYITHTKDFIILLGEMMDALHDQHSGMGISVWWYSYSYYKEDIKINNITEKDFGLHFHYVDILNSIYPDENYLNLIYLNGKYFLKYKTTFFNKTDSILLPAGTHIIAFDKNQNIFPDSYSSCYVHWDFERKHFYYDELPFDSNIHTVTLMYNDTLLEWQFNTIKQEIIEKEWDYKNFYQDVWLAEDSILYLKMPRMLYTLLKPFQPKLLAHKKKKIKATIIDIRGNHGGDDLTWIELLGNITNHTLKYPFCLISNDTNSANLLFEDKKNRKYKSISYDCITEPNTFTICQQTMAKIKKKRENIHYNGVIYLLVDNDVYSSARGLSSLSYKTDRIKTIGIPTGMLQGQGTNDHAFILPNSRFIFTLDLYMDAANVVHAEDFYFDKVSYPIHPSLDYFIYWYNNTSTDINQNELYKDELFLKALEIIKQEEKKNQ
jgi:hypothetical protein